MTNINYVICPRCDGTGTIIEGTITKEERLWQRIITLPPIVRAAVKALIEFEEQLDPMGYDLSYYDHDLPKIVAKAIEPWKEYDQ